MVHICVQLLYGTAGKEIVMRPCAQLSSSFTDSLDVSQEKIVIRNRYGEKLVGVLHEAGSNDIVGAMDLDHQRMVELY
jgi:hypothetical protein